MNTTSFRDLESAALTAMTVTERERFDAAQAEEDERLRLAELVYTARTGAGLTQAALAARIGSKQSVISAIENGAQIPTFPMLRRIAGAVDRTLSIELAAAS
ncbi:MULTISPECIES: helix-turn-helix transcriptional regulator [unclassified Microbacterium]|uniref:helix-turn-helix domain-containing protein n=1 Tax=unclassified Microbacterium TaxID=2609290 RepID=UPI000CFBC17C|nr:MULTISPECIES: helix-turn-helix transcriptional regulator [unclassified Microbacterium]PQZ53532.1 transcriptional regulator [Microbacterium sp. MYb43]PQZ75134.1 transcriptional regulator [Microbacterium sp. MYb40]PRB19429.1 transcriptional regulator [Microbacterium sp. MYb54]PRB24630.1 transcriptional regulator [Microbacterium sp. MYb50]PRB63741.1 transcriptional regulator [Microbacterium sp. MYb24]